MLSNSSGNTGFEWVTESEPDSNPDPKECNCRGIV